MPVSTPPIRVAILGGGLAGVTVFHGLLRVSNLDVQIFESAPAFREQGQGVGFNESAIWAMEIMGLRDRLTAAQAVKMNVNRCMIAQGSDAGRLAWERGTGGRGTWIVQRAQFLTELLKGVDESRLHPGKKLESLIQDEESIKLQFEDGTTHECDILLGADGIYSTVRKYVVGHDHPSTRPYSAGWSTVWTLVPFDKAQKMLGTDLMNPNDPAQYAWCGNGSWIMHDQLRDNTLTQCVIAWRVPEDEPIDWQKTTNKRELNELMGNLDHKIGKSMVNLVSDGKEAINLVGLQHHKVHAPQYVRDRIAIVGDAADAPTPWKGAGGGMSVQDALILSTVFQQVRTIHDAKAALKVYEKMQQPRRQRLIKESYDTGITFSGCDLEVGLSAEGMKNKLYDTWDWILNVDQDKQVSDARQAMLDFQGGLA